MLFLTIRFRIQMSLAKDVSEVNHVAAALKQPVSAACEVTDSVLRNLSPLVDKFAMQKSRTAVGLV